MVESAGALVIPEGSEGAVASSRGQQAQVHRIAVIPGDGIGLEVVPAGMEVLDAAASVDGTFQMRYETFPWSCRYYHETGRMAPPDFLEQLRGYDAIFLGAVGDPSVPDHVSLWGLLLPIRRTFRQYVNLRPARLLRGVPTPLAGRGPADIDFWVVRENNEGEYSNMGGRLYPGTPDEIVIQNSVFTRRGVERVMRYAFELARRHPKRRLTSATKSNGINHTMPFWDEVFRALSSEYPDVATDQYHIDALAARFVTHPQRFGVVVASNLFGDILTDLGAAIAGSIGIAPSANLNPERVYPSMFEPIHGSAPDIAGQGIANPIGQIWSGAMMLEHLGHPGAARRIMAAVEHTLGDRGVKTPDLGGKATTRQVTQTIIDALLEGEH
ncbi:tartrate dehydrogenase [Carboxydochorda subterranea]|uniref:D-malate dehydrogenase (decarboxylating) n=1 Tax=Carboxydichorda subterranea TaxID=3109565 RepID=A0ABZ1BXH1_9FIRM|nr:tartrate dehydrogenase [Limnochorda sp. L945t]WRP17195.1 tartrate dehydrogenase [Limnochorda sp. L945t]